MNSKVQKKQYELYRRKLILQQFQRIFVPFGPIIFLSFCILDYYMLGDLLSYFISRAFISLFSFVFIIPYVKRNILPRIYFYIPLIPIIMFNSYIGYLMSFHGEKLEIYFVGLIIVSSSISAMFECVTKQSILASAFTAVTFYVYVYFNIQTVNDLSGNFFIITFFLHASLITDILRSKSVEQTAIKNFKNRYILRYERILRDRIIEKKSKEIVQGELLNSQFSPQISRMFKSGELKVDQFEEAQVTTVVIDIVNSTFKLATIPPINAYKVLEDVFDLISKVLLKWDLTIDKFTGDGVMALSNAPVNHEDHIERAMNACIEINSQMIKKSDYFCELWEGELQLKYAIHSGQAHYGFIGRGQVKNFTAVGKNICLAYRICDIAAPNSIAISEETYNKISHQDFSIETKFESKKDESCKGFTQKIPTIQLSFTKNTRENSENELKCEKCHQSNLYVEKSKSGTYSMKCRNCEDLDQRISSIRNKKAA